MRNDNKKNVIVGIFVFIGIAILVAGVLTLGGQQKKFVKSIRLKAVFDDVAGLQPGNNVWFSGVKIGNVRRINFYGDSQVEIEMNIESKTKDFIRKDSKATISSDGLIGNKIIVLYGGTSAAGVVEDGDRLLTEMPLDTEQMMVTLQENNQNLVSITNDLKTLTGKIAAGEGIIGSTLMDTTIAESFKTMLLNFESSSRTANQMLVELNRFSRELNKEGNLIHDLTTDDALYAGLKETMASFQSTAGQLERMTESLNAITDKLQQSDNTAGLLLNDEETAATMKSLVNKLDESATSLNAGLDALEYTWPFRRGFKRKAKAEEAASR
ncbi:MAG: MlaD family protein [Nitritalea sp.]